MKRQSEARVDLGANVEENVADQPALIVDSGFMVDGSNVVYMGIIMASIIAITVFAFVGIGLLIRRYVRRKRCHDDEFWDLGKDAEMTRSAPNTRSSSPISKRKQTRSKSRDETAADILRSVSADMLPDLTKERVQPRSPDDPKRSESASRYQANRGDAIALHGNSFNFECDETSPSPPSSPSTPNRLYYKMFYDVTKEELIVTLVKAKNLNGRDKSKCPRDPFIRLYLLPNESSVHQSRVHRKTNNPIFNETFSFQVPESEILERTLRMSVYDVDKRRLRHCLGHVIQPLRDADLLDQEIRWGDLESTAQNQVDIGDIGITLEYSSFDEQLWVAIMGVNKIKTKKIKRGSEIFVKVTLIEGGRTSILCKKTTSQAAQTDLVFNESLGLNINIKQLESYSVIISVIVRDPPSKKSRYEEEYGRVSIGSYLFARGNTLIHWQDTISQPRTPITMTHQLVPPPDFTPPE